MEIICAYIRNNAPARDAKDFPGGDLEPLAKNADSDARKAHLELIEARKSELYRWLDTLAAPREDIMLALTILERRSDRQRRIEAAHGREGLDEADWPFAKPAPELPEPPDGQPHPEGAIRAYLTRLQTWQQELADYSGYRPDLRGTCLQRASLAGFRMAGVRLDKARLEGANLLQARLKGTSLLDANMRGARLDAAELQGAELRRAQGQGADFSRARLQGANLMMTNLQAAEFSRAHMQGANLWEARIQGASFWAVQLQGANLPEAQLQFAVLGQAQIQEAFLQGARLQGTDLRSARLRDAILTEAQLDRFTNLADADLAGCALSSVNLSTVRISQDQINESFGDASVILPAHLSPAPSHWPTWNLEFDMFDNRFDHEYHRWRSNPANYSPPPRPTP